MFESYSTEDLWTYIKNNVEAGNWSTACAEMDARIIQANDPDDNEGSTPGAYQTKGGIRPYHAPTII